MDKAILLQKQVRDNSEDLQREFLDMQAWEEQMKKKDLEIRNLKDDDRVLPPIRKKKKKTSSVPEASKKQKPDKAKRIPGSDYESWDKFDVDKACEEIEETNDTEETIYEIPSEEVLEKEHAQATELKEEGNILVQKKEYAKAVSKYSEAIKIFPEDATFYANRALCQLKLDNLYSAESDCTAAIQLDSKYVKAYHRRATARMELKRYVDAEKDIQMVLELDPQNKQAKSLLALVQEKIEKTSKKMIITEIEQPEKSSIEIEQPEKSSIEKEIGKKLAKKISNKAQDKSIKSEEQNKKKTDQSESLSISKDEKTAVQEIETEEDKKEKEKEEKLKRLKESEKKNEPDDGLPSWLPKLKEDVTIIYPVEKHPKKKQILKRIDIKEIPENESIFDDIIKEVKKENINKPVIEKEIIPKVENIKSENKTSNNDINVKIEEVSESFPPPPKTSVAFLINWRKNVSLEFRYKYLKQINPQNLPNIFKESMESNIFSDILLLLNEKFSEEDKVYDYLYYLTKVKRIRALLLFMTKKDKEALKNLFERCKNVENRTNEEVNDLCSAYEM